MEYHLVRKDIKKCQAIYYHPEYLLFSGNRFQSCAKKGGPLFTYPEVRTAIHGFAILPDYKLLVDDAKSVLHILDLKTGRVLLSKKTTNKRICQSRFVVSEDGKFAYRIWSWTDWDLAKISLDDLSMAVYRYPASLYGVRDIVYQEKDRLVVLENQNISIDGRAVSEKQITSITIENGECAATPLYQWTDGGAGLKFDGRYVLESGFVIRDPSTSESFSLLENSHIHFPERYVSLSSVYYPEYGYLQLVDETYNTFIDCATRKVIARYANNPKQLIFQGICMGDEFWIGRSDGIYAAPFPAFEEE